jgi:hypothetical protein
MEKWRWEKAHQKSVGVKPERRGEVLAVTAKILAYRRGNKGNGKIKGAVPER